MLPTFVIGLREGLEAALIIGIVAAFLRQRGRSDTLRWMWLGVAGAVALCAGVAFGLHLAEENLPQRQQEQLETLIALAAVGMISWMIVWMRRHSADLRGDLHQRAEVALVEGSALGLVAMAFLAVLREGLETAVFLLAAFQQSDRPGLTGTGALLGVAAAVLLGSLIYRGGVKINLSKFFRVTGVVLVLVGAGLLTFAVHTAHEAGWWHLLLDALGRPPRDHRSRVGAVRARHRHVRDPARTDLGRDPRLPRLRGPDDRLRVPPDAAAPGIHHAGAGAGRGRRRNRLTTTGRNSHDVRRIGRAGALATLGCTALFVGLSAAGAASQDRHGEGRDRRRRLPGQAEDQGRPHELQGEQHRFG